VPQILLSKNFSLAEFTLSQTAIRKGIANDVAPDSPQFHNLERLCRAVLQPLREQWGAVHINSGYRCPKLNRAIGGARTSQHTLGLAADIVMPGGATPLEVCGRLIAMQFPFDQLIHEFGAWCHVSVAAEGATPRSQVLTASRDAATGKTVYTPGLHPV